VRTEWTGGPKETNGAYGLYPVACKNVLIDGCIAIGASDAGIYVGQSQNIIVRNSIVKYNVAGIEIENCYNADVYNNLATHNAGGLLVFDLPNLPQQGGHNVRFFGNISVDNDTKNFAPEGNIVGLVPTGTGLMIMANRNVEVFDNVFSGNGTANITISSYAGNRNEGKKLDPNYLPNPAQIHIHHNTFSGSGTKPMGIRGEMMQQAARSEKLPDIVWDGRVKEGTTLEDAQIYIHSNGPADFVNLDLDNFAKDPKSNKPRWDLAPHAGYLPPVPAAHIAGVTYGTD
jgi:parallel beta-helix repeat protein